MLALALPLALLALLALLLVLLLHAASPAPAVSAVIAATAATVMCRIVTYSQALALSSSLVGFRPGQHIAVLGGRPNSARMSSRARSHWLRRRPQVP